MVIGEHYGIRLKLRRGEPLHRVELLGQAKSGIWRVRFLDDPNPGFIDYVRSRSIIVRWRDKEAFLHDEAASAEVRSVSRQQVTAFSDLAVADATDAVLNAAADIFVEESDDYVAVVPLTTARQVGRRAGFLEPPWEWDSAAFVDRHGSVHLPFRAAYRLARAYAVAEPLTVRRALEEEKRSLRYERVISYAQARRRACDLALEWVGAEPLPRSPEIARLERLLIEAVRLLRERGADMAADRIEEELTGVPATRRRERKPIPPPDYS